MIKADHKLWADFVFEKYLNRLFKKNFHSINVLNKLPETKKELPLIVIPNHSYWWDGFFIYYLNKNYLNRKFHILMLEDQLKKYWFFRKLGAFSIDLNNNFKIYKTLKYTAEILNEKPAPLLNIYPQGVLEPVHKRPLGFKDGINTLIKLYKGDIQIMPLGMKILNLKEQKPEVFFYSDKVITANGNHLPVIAELEADVGDYLNFIDNYVLKETNHDFMNIINKNNIRQI